MDIPYSVMAIVLYIYAFVLYTKRKYTIIHITILSTHHNHHHHLKTKPQRTIILVKCSKGLNVV